MIYKQNSAKLNRSNYGYASLTNQTSVICLSYLPTSPLGQDRTQGQFLSGV